MLSEMVMELLSILDFFTVLYWLVEYRDRKCEWVVNMSMFGSAGSCPSLKREMINTAPRNLIMKH